MKQKLLSKKYSEEEISSTLEELIAKKYLQERHYARLRIKSLAMRGLSSEMILKKCQAEHLSVDHDLIDDVRLEFKISEDEAIEKLIAKKISHQSEFSRLSQEDKRKQQQKVLRYLISKGHSYQNALKHWENTIS